MQFYISIIANDMPEISLTHNTPKLLEFTSLTIETNKNTFTIMQFI
jgi:hypothetical protein